MDKIRIGIIFGGKSAEHEVSLQSAKNVIAALDKEKYDTVLIGIDKQGKWHLQEAANFLLHENDPKLISLNQSSQALSVLPGDSQTQIISATDAKAFSKIDVVFPVMHGTYGEDGSIQGMLKMLDLPFVGPSILGSAVGMDKDVAKRLMRDAGIPVAKFLTFSDPAKVDIEKIKTELGLPVFVKPANLGSSVGINKAKTDEELKQAIDEAFSFDRKIIIEESIVGREIECAVLGNENPKASIPGEIIPKLEFYSYEAKYIDDKGSESKIPAELTDDQVIAVQVLAVKTFKTLGLEGMSRVDFFLQEDGKLLVNEVNTIPGFTNISMYPKMWEATGLPYSQLLDTLIGLAIERHEKEKRLKTSK